jgi:hypothetical protein
MISAKIILDSITEKNDRIVTFLITMWKPLAAELNTHRVFTKNAGSSRAIPFKEVVKSVIKNPFIPMAFQKSHSGMQGTKYFNSVEKVKFGTIAEYLVTKFKHTEGKPTDPIILELLTRISETVAGERTLTEWWLFIRDKVVECATLLHCLGVTKQICNRLLEPFMWHTVLLTTTELENFFKQRCPQYYFAPLGEYFRSKKDFVAGWNKAYDDDINGYKTMKKATIKSWTTGQWNENFNKGQAEIHMMEVAECMWDALNESTPQLLQPGEWHIPFYGNFDEEKLKEALLEITPHGSYQIGSGLVTGKRGAVEYNIMASKYSGIDPYKIVKLIIATARCARVSYLNFKSKDDYLKDIKLFKKLIESEPAHWSPTEHCAKVMTEEEYYTMVSGEFIDDYDSAEVRILSDKSYGWCKNYKGFIQLRHILENNLDI